MPATSVYLTEYKDMIAQLSALYGRRYQSSEPDDIAQELWMWFVTHKKKYAEWSELEQKDRDNLIAKSLRNAATKYCEKEKAKAAGYDISDLYYYDASVIEAFLPTIIGNSYELPSKIKDLGYKPATNDVSDGMNWLVLRSDIARAFSMLDKPKQYVLLCRFTDESAEWADVGVALETTADGARMKVKRAVNALIKNLGGWRTHEEDQG